jgi:hypothetical protein
MSKNMPWERAEAFIRTYIIEQGYGGAVRD